MLSLSGGFSRVSFGEGHRSRQCLKEVLVFLRCRQDQKQEVRSRGRPDPSILAYWSAVTNSDSWFEKKDARAETEVEHTRRTWVAPTDWELGPLFTLMLVMLWRQDGCCADGRGLHSGAARWAGCGEGDGDVQEIASSEPSSCPAHSSIQAAGVRSLLTVERALLSEAAHGQNLDAWLQRSSPYTSPQLSSFGVKCSSKERTFSHY